ncbi:MAG: threonine synthase [Gammaproteobacteria bacterium]|nr:threonine synthase [Gammaproteobacteria bacterium]MYD76193.1 threonine synthase [Gammaproteobacteria bacterium]MYJ52496.1 threonine synthase [Gammaproteobacteria bacterium]
MDYISTRGQAPLLDFERATLRGLADDGGLYLPSSWPVLSHDEMHDLQGHSYPDLALCIIEKFTGDCLPGEALRPLIDEACARFRHDAVAPVKQLDDRLFLMELFHGPTLAFKDYALQILGRLFQHFLVRRSQTCTILGATSGDTGSAAIAGLKGLPAIELFMLHPHNRVSGVQRRQMTTVLDDNIHNIAVEGTFDDCQNLVKSLFNDLDFKTAHSLSAVNSINWARIAAQVVYYFRAALALGAPEREISFSVPTGNFGNVLAGYVAKKMGLPIRKLIIGSNENDILTRFFETGSMERRDVRTTLSPSMDIGISSNFERYLFELVDHDSDRLNGFMHEFQENGRFEVGRDLLARARQDFSAYRLTDEDTRKDIKTTFDATGEIIDPHSIIGVSAARQEGFSDAPVVVLATAHPAKFPEAIRSALGFEAPLPAQLADLFALEERCAHLPDCAASLKRFIETTLA